jgi:hypothetical protein
MAMRHGRKVLRSRKDVSYILSSIRQWSVYNTGVKTVGSFTGGSSVCVLLRFVALESVQLSSRTQIRG